MYFIHTNLFLKDKIISDLFRSAAVLLLLLAEVNQKLIT